MSCLSLTKKLQPAKMAWKSFTNTLQSKLHKLKKSKAIKRTTRRLIALRSVHHPIVSYKRRALDRHRFSTLPHNHHSRHNLHDQHQEPPQKSAATIYVDELFEETVSVHANHPHEPGDTNKAKEMNAANDAVNKAKAKADTASMTTRRQQQQQQQPMSTVGIKVFDGKVKPRKSKASEKSAFDVDDAWKAIIASSPQLRGVDERAEEFISKFHEEMKLQKEKSILDFEEMLARSA
ncbi:hypothetical protein L1049_017009 [Liquidambar formosana]|uniref:Uncharacterized protein n=1 Tax=Liquidambar formosana TaxID=63359 RepID=A0AAP0X7X0_LIQFO